MKRVRIFGTDSGQPVTETLKKKDFLEQLFAREYLLDLNGTRAAIAVGYSSKTAAQRVRECQGKLRFGLSWRN